MEQKNKQPANVAKELNDESLGKVSGGINILGERKKCPMCGNTGSLPCNCSVQERNAYIFSD